MEGELLLTAIATLGVTLAGFAGLVTALGRGNLTPFTGFRIRVLVASGLSVAFESLVPLVIYEVDHAARATILASSVIGFAWLSILLLSRVRELRHHWDRAPRASVLAAGSAIVALTLHAANVLAWASLAAYTAALLTQLLVATTSFYTLVGERVREREG